MSASRPDPDWARVRRVYEEVSELPAAERRAALDKACSGDPELREAVHRLLEHDSTEGDAFLAAPLARLANLLPAEGFELAAGTILGDFRIVSRLGEGGMGAVYEAEQRQPFRRVALKVLRPDLVTADALRRFDVEIESLARMQHPDIARVHAAGLHTVRAQGVTVHLPWFAMELVRGASDILSHARSRLRDRTERLALVARVAEAVHHAHLRGIVHRDLKPANVLVDESGAPKVIDFGIARAIDASASPGGTRTGALLGTPRYMAPEQKGGSADVDARCDVWALGCILSELLDRPRGSPHREELPPPPALPRGLEWILARACAEAPAERYGSALALAEDLQRFLRGDAVLAAPPSLVYEWSQILRRHRTAFLGAALVLVALGSGLLLTLRALEGERRTNLALQRAREESDARRVAAEEAGARAERELGLRAATLELVKRTITTARSRFGSSLTIAQLVTELGRELERAPKGSSLLLGASWSYLADVALASGDPVEAERLQRNALGSFEGGPLDPQALREQVLGLCGLAEILRLRGRLDECSAAIGEAERIANEHELGLDLHGSILRRKVLLALQLRDFSGALGLAEENLALRRSLYDPRSPQVVEALLDRGVAAVNAQGSDDALALLEQAVDAAESILGPLDQKTLIGRNNLASAYARREDWARSASILEGSIEAFVSLYGAEHPSALTMRSNLAKAWNRLGRDAEAAEIFEELLAVALRTQDARPLPAVEILELRRLASFSRRRGGAPARAAELLAGVCEFDPREDQATFEKRCACCLEYGRALAVQGDRTAARRVLERTRAELLLRVGEDDPLVQAVSLELSGLDARG